MSPLERLRVALCIRLGEARVALPTRHPDFADCRQEWEAHCCRIRRVCVRVRYDGITKFATDCRQRQGLFAVPLPGVMPRTQRWLLIEWRGNFSDAFSAIVSSIERSGETASDMFERIAKKKTGTANVVINLDISSRPFHFSLFYREETRIVCSTRDYHTECRDFTNFGLTFFA